MKKQLLMKTFLVAVSLLVGTSAWAYEVPTGYEIKTVIMGTNNGDGTVTAENFTSATAVPAGWVAGDNIALSIGDVTEVTDLVVDDHGPSYVSGKCLGVAASKQDWDYKFATYSFTAVSSGYLVFNGDFYVDNNQSAYLKFADEDGKNVFSFYPKSGSNGQTFKYILNDGSETASSYQTKPRTYKGWRVRDMVFDMSTGALTFKLTYIQFTSGGTSEQTINVAYNIGTGKSIAKLMIGSNTNNENKTKTAFLDNVSLFHVGVAASAKTYTINAKAGSTVIKELATGHCSEGDTYNATGLPYVINYNGDFYYLNDNTVSNFGTQNYTMGDEDETKDITYTLDADIVYFNDCGSANSTGSNASCSGGNYGAWNTTQTISGLNAGVYTVTVKTYGKYGNNWRGEVFAINDVEVGRIAPEAVGISSLDVVVPVNSSPITFWKTYNYTDYCDYILIKRKSDLPATEKIVVTSAGYATYVSNYNLDFTGATTKAYKVSVASKGVATLNEVTKIPARTPVLLIAAGGNGEGEAITVSSDAMDAITGNNLVPGLGFAVATTDGDNTNMILNNVSGIGFYFANGQTVALNRAYLHIATSLAPDAATPTPARLVFADDVTGISATLKNKEIEDKEVYNLKGQRVAQPTKGLYIQNGKKVIIK